MDSQLVKGLGNYLVGSGENFEQGMLRTPSPTSLFRVDFRAFTSFIHAWFARAITCKRVPTTSQTTHHIFDEPNNFNQVEFDHIREMLDIANSTITITVVGGKEGLHTVKR